MSEEASDYWRLWAEHAQAISPLYAHLARVIGADEKLRRLAGHARAGQPPANMILGAVHFLLLRGASHPLARFYATLGGNVLVGDEDPLPDFADFVSLHTREIAHLIETRVTNTNEVGRSAVLHPGLRIVAAEAGTPLNLVEIGPSAGLNMIWDHYAVRYTHEGKAAQMLAPDKALVDGSPLVIDAELRGDGVPPMGHAPVIARRIGLERNPVDLENDDDRDWLRALVWPDAPARLERLDRAVSLFRDTRAEVEICPGDALENFLPILRTIPEDQPVCVYHTIALYQFSRSMKAALEDILTVAGLRRTVWRLSFEQEERAQHFGATLAVTRYHDGACETRRLALCQPHGAWLEWLG